jgi:hypothetical protein
VVGAGLLIGAAGYVYNNRDGKESKDSGITNKKGGGKESKGSKITNKNDGGGGKETKGSNIKKN